MKTFKVFANLGIFLGISMCMEKWMESGASFLGRRIFLRYQREPQEYLSPNQASIIFLPFSTCIPKNVQRLARTLKTLANLEIFQGISVEKKKKNGARWVGRGIILWLSGISSWYPSLRQASTVFLPFFKQICRNYYIYMSEMLIAYVIRSDWYTVCTFDLGHWGLQCHPSLFSHLPQKRFLPFFCIWHNILIKKIHKRWKMLVAPSFKSSLFILNCYKVWYCNPQWPKVNVHYVYATHKRPRGE